MDITCRVCKSKDLQKFEGELTVTLVGLKGLRVPPTYVCRSVLICLSCGFAELLIPPDELQSLRRGITSLDS
jgi:hypothetical protein